MAYYNNAFVKHMFANGATVTNTTSGFLVTTAGLNMKQVADLGKGYVAILDADTYKTINPTTTYPTKFIIANTSMLSQDKYGSHGGFQMVDLSKMINKNYVERVYTVQAGDPLPYVISVGNDGSQQTGTCTPVFYCDQDIFFRVDIKGSAMLRTYVRNMYRMIHVKTPCCVGGTIAQIDPTWVFIEIANAILNDPYLKNYVLPIVYSNGADGTTGVNYIAPASAGITYPYFVTATSTWDTYTLGNSVNVANVDAGIILIGAYEDTQFGNCSFLPTDYQEYQPIKLIAEFVDFNGNPCETLQYCTNVLSTGHSGNGSGLQAQKDILMSQSYLTNYLSDDPRIREVTGGVDMLIDRTQRYRRIGIIHTIPRHMGMSNDMNLGIHNTDRYVVDIIHDISNGGGAALLTFFQHVLNGTTAVIDTTSGAYTGASITIS